MTKRLAIIAALLALTMPAAAITEARADAVFPTRQVWQCEVDVGPLGGQELATPCASQKQEAHSIGRHLIVKVGKSWRESGYFSCGQVAVPLVLLVALDALARIVAPPAPTNRQREHAAQNGDGSVCVGRGAGA